MRNSWFDEISFDPAAPLLQMGTRKLGVGSWLIGDDDRESDLALKHSLLASRHEEVFVASEDSMNASELLLGMVRNELERSGIEAVSAQPGLHQPGLHQPGRYQPGLYPLDSRPHPLEEAALLVQEDLCLMHFREGTWHLDAACLCFPSRWILADKAFRPLVEVHGPVKDYDPVLVDRVNGVFDRLLNRPEDRPVWRRNWFVHPSPDRFQPSAPVGGDPVVESQDLLDGLWMRSERQILRKVAESDWAVFSIRIQQASLGELFLTEGNQERVIGYLRGSSVADAAHHGIGARQRQILLDTLG